MSHLGRSGTLLATSVRFFVHSDPHLGYAVAMTAHHNVATGIRGLGRRKPSVQAILDVYQVGVR